MNYLWWPRTKGMQAPPEELVLVTAGGCLALAGLWICWRSFSAYNTQRVAVRRAKQASGTITQATVQPVRESATAQSYVPTVQYEYQTPTQRLSGTSIYPGSRSRLAQRYTSQQAAARVVDSYQPGAAVTVYYDPQQPGHSFLRRTIQTGPLFSRAVLGCLLLLFGIGLVWFGY